MQFVKSTSHDRENPDLLRLALTTVARTLLSFTLPYIVAYYCVIGAWQGIHLFLLWMNAAR
jgi:hypothetical protein